MKIVIHPTIQSKNNLWIILCFPIKFINLSLFEGTSGILQFGATTELVSFESLLIKPGPEKLKKNVKK